MLSIDEAIEQFKTMANDARGEIIHGDDLEPQEKYYNSQLESCVEEKEQLAEWLEELKAYREIGTVEECKGCVLEILEAYNKAIDDFVHECDKCCGFYSGKNKNITREDILKIAKQLKVGVENE